MTIAVQWFSESITTIEAVFSVWSMPKTYKRSEFGVVKFSRKLEERIETRSTGGQHVKTSYVR
jgi:hypothetical protein